MKTFHELRYEGYLTFYGDTPEAFVQPACTTATRLHEQKEVNGVNYTLVKEFYPDDSHMDYVLWRQTRLVHGEVRRSPEKLKAAVVPS